MTIVNRRGFLGCSVAGAAALGSLELAAKTQELLTVTALRAAQLPNPIGLTDAAPSLSWQIVGSRRGVTQQAYRIHVATSLAALKAGKADLWDSGRVSSAESIGIRYGGLPLASRQRAWWTVSIWDDSGARATAVENAYWEMALLEPTDWSATWLAAERVVDKADREAGLPSYGAPVPPEGQPRLFRLPFATENAGDVVITLLSSGFLSEVTIDGKALEMPAHPKSSFGPPGAARFVVSLEAGAHMLAMHALPPRDYTPAKEISVAAQIRVPRSESTLSRITAGWETALGAPDGWRLPGSSNGWDAPILLSPQPHAAWPATPAIQMRHMFKATRKPKVARLYVAALGAYEMRLNGDAVSEDRLQSESSDYRKTILYRCYDVTDLIGRGENVLGALIGDGWYASYMAPAGRYAFGPAPRRLIAQLEIDGAVAAQTGPGWSMAPSPIIASDLYDGESYDARLEQPGWDRPGFNDATWTRCWEAEAPQGKLVAQSSPAIRITNILQPKASVILPTGATVIDFGQNFAGLARLKLRGKAGQTVTMRFAEILYDDGSVDQRNLRGADATDRYTLRGDAKGEVYLPHFTFHGFRYVQVEGAPAEWSIEGMVMRSELAETGMMKIDNPVVQKLWLNTLWSQRSNFFAIPTDCPQRDERLGWTGDAQVFWDTAAFNMDVAAFTRRFLRDLRDAQTPKGAFPIFAPTVSSAPGASPGWADAGVMLPWICWRRYGDTTMVTEHWDAMCRYVDGVIADNPDLIWRKVLGANFGDWLSLDADQPADETTPRALVATAMLKRSLDQMADMGLAIGKTKQAEHYRAQAHAAARAFQKTFVEANGRIGNGSHASYILAIRMSMLTAEQKVAAGARLVEDIRRRGTLLSTGFLATPLSLDAIADIGAADLVYDLLLRTAFPSWGYMVSKGATTIWERWNGDTGDVAMNSYNHYALGAVVAFFYRRIAGIDELEPGFRTVRIAPLMDPRVPSVGAEYRSARGPISVNWTQRPDGSFRLDASIPANMRAEIHLPLAAGRRVLSDGRDVALDRSIRIKSGQEPIAVLETGSGRYRLDVA
ncbi:alpha-L-rhamnosidase [Sphingobium sp. B7D2B]|uniref:alpha-L-rhamnosidase n=1 Tax=Sphingobium sp. B7D2B TaxID=2940583 RepID=UPI0022252D18|nr:alpha-L-rhamnosidase [Sphingobium sp. B7D2B]MCW2365150.1 alpha-L-rhamnosidase [Sphingobium sp. B7D2B]